MLGATMDSGDPFSGHTVHIDGSGAIKEDDVDSICHRFPSHLVGKKRYLKDVVTKKREQEAHQLVRLGKTPLEFAISADIQSNSMCHYW